MQRFQINPKVSVSIVFVSAMFVSIMDGTIVNVALPSIQRQLGVSGSAIDAVVVAYLLSLAAVIPASGWLGDRFGSKRIFLFSMALFTIASALCGLAQNFSMLVIFRALQGIAGGALMPSGTALLYRTFPPAQRVQVSRILIIPTVIAPAIGPVLGGILVVQLSWHWVFFVNVPIGIAVCIFALLFLQEHASLKTGAFDLAGFLLAGIGLALVMYALTEGPGIGWSSPLILVSIILGLCLLGLFVVVEQRKFEPMLNLRLFNDRAFRTSNIVTFFSSAGFLSMLFLSPLFLQEARGADAFTSGLTTFPEAIGVVISTQIVARLYPIVGPRRLTSIGLLCVAFLIGGLAFIGLTTNLWIMRTIIFCIGAGMAFSFLPMQTTAFATITDEATGQASTIYNAQRQIGSSLGITVVSTVLGIFGMVQAGRNGVLVPNVNAYHAAFIAAAVLSLIGAGFAFTIHDSDAAPTMVPRKKKTDLPEIVIDAGTQVELSNNHASSRLDPTPD